MALKWQKHEILTPPSDDEIAVMTVDELEKSFRLYHEIIRLSIEDPYRHGFIFDNWKRADLELEDLDELLALGGNRSSKTRYGARSVVKAAVENPGSEIFCFAQTSEVSIRQQQAAVWEWLPREYKTKLMTPGAYIAYTKKNGFTDSSLILPNGSQIIFKTYSQYQNNPTILEGAELGSKAPKWLNVGAWLDEYLLGPDLISTIRFRLATRNAKLLVTFTPIDGWTEVISDYLKGAKTVESKRAELLNNELVPFVQHSANRNAAVIYFHSKDNPFGGYDRIANDLKNSSRETILIRAYGVPTKSYTTVFPKFSIDVNVVDPSIIPTSGVTRYQIIDPAGTKNWFMAWIAVDATGTFWVYREWPGVRIGDWAEQSGNGKWKPGPGAKGLGFGLRDYIEGIFEDEGKNLPAEVSRWESCDQWKGGEEIFERLVDPRYSASKYQKDDSESCMLDDFRDLHFDVVPAPGDHIEDGIQKLADLMAYDTSKEIDSVNRPRFYVSSDCQNIIAAIAEYTGTEGKDEAWKDPIDCLRYAAAAGIDHVTAGRAAAAYSGAGGY